MKEESKRSTSVAKVNLAAFSLGAPFLNDCSRRRQSGHHSEGRKRENISKHKQPSQKERERERGREREINHPALGSVIHTGTSGFTTSKPTNTHIHKHTTFSKADRSKTRVIK